MQIDVYVKEDGVDGIGRRDAGGVMELTLDRADKKNAITTAMYRAMIAALAGAERADDIHAVLIAGAGGAFSAGNDLADFLGGPEGAQAAFDFIRALAAFDKPIVAAVQGLAVGIGTTMLLHCDLVYAAPDARFVMPFVNLGLVPEAASSLLAPALIGRPKASAMLLLGEPMEADAADRAGLVTVIVPADRLLDHARAKAVALGRQPPRALAHTRRLLRGDPEGVMRRIDEEARLFREAMQSAEAREAFAAFLDKRAPDFNQAKGR